ncbi:MAG: sulfotransferase [Pseudomonadota bacterium]
MREARAPEVGQSERLPDFIIGGAPKCGTTSLHFVLDQHPDIGMPEDEIHYFDADDPITHPDFFFVDRGRLVRYDNDPGNEAFRAKYAARFAPFAGRGFVGEDSTTYLFSAVAPVRIQAMLPEVRLIFMLRDPVARAYSQYFHGVKSGRITDRFERALVTQPSIVLGSTYLPHLERYAALFGRERVKVVVFEDFVKDTQGVVDEVTGFLGAPGMTVDPDRSWYNRTFYPTWLGGQLSLNIVGSRIVARRYVNHLDSRGGWRVKLDRKIHYHWFERVNPILLKAERPAPMAEDTRAYLTDHLSKRNAGLSAFLDRDMGAIWKGFTG